MLLPKMTSHFPDLLAIPGTVIGHSRQSCYTSLTRQKERLTNQSPGPIADHVEIKRDVCAVKSVRLVVVDEHASPGCRMMGPSAAI
jgi:hypothetical protein